MGMSMAHVCGDVAADLWRAAACAAANGVNGMKAAKPRRTQTKERYMTTSNGHKESDRRETATDRFAAKAHETVDSIAERAQRAEREVRGAAEQARDFQEQATERAEQTVRRAGSYVENNPLAFVGIAFAAGVLLSTLLRR
jgi:ElaB/YqjD/DUF883 family membrane-anchored ribosome-binding protein